MPWGCITANIYFKVFRKVVLLIYGTICDYLLSLNVSCYVHIIEIAVHQSI